MPYFTLDWIKKSALHIRGGERKEQCHENMQVWSFDVQMCAQGAAPHLG